MVPEVFMWLAVVGALFTANAWWPARRLGPFIIISFFAAWLTAELALHHLAWQVAATLIFIALGALEGWQGWVGLAICGISWAGLLGLVQVAKRAGPIAESALDEALGAGYRDSILPEIAQRMNAHPIRLRHLLPFRLRHPGVGVERNIAYVEGGGRRQKLDIYSPIRGTTQAPVLLQIHGGGWYIGSKEQQGLPLMNHMAARGWVCVAVNYRLSPKVAFPEHLIDVKRALKWIRENINRYGGDPDFVVATGGSAGGHLSAHLSLTANAAEYQPEFEDVDTRIRACVPFYGIYDVTNDRPDQAAPGMSWFFEKYIMQKSRAENPEIFRRSSPLHRITADAPPFFVIHGSHDSLAWVEGARSFVKALRQTSRSPVAYAEILRAQHAFEIFHSPRTSLVVDAVGRFLAGVYSDYLREDFNESLPPAAH